MSMMRVTHKSVVSVIGKAVSPVGQAFMSLIEGH